jgi:Fuc2NAc and GlcNAc transferase
MAKLMLDIPNERSSHTRPTPRGGGLGIAIVVLIGIALAGAVRWIPFRTAVGLEGGVLAVAVIGWLDDHRGLPALVRAAVHLAAATWAVAWLGGYARLAVGTTCLGLGVGGSVLAVLGIAWATNLYNFMDGIDGIAAAEGVSVGVFGGVLLALAGRPGLAVVACVVAGASAGFLPWNWSPARIFMGDVGSGVLGFSVAALAVASENSGGPPVALWVLLLGVFVFDATVTLVRRMLRGERWFAAHRSHAYQRAVLAGWAHASVSGFVVLLTTGLGVLSVVATARPELTVFCLVLAGVVLSAVYLLVERVMPMGTAVAK